MMMTTRVVICVAMVISLPVQNALAASTYFRYRFKVRLSEKTPLANDPLRGLRKYCHVNPDTNLEARNLLKSWAWACCTRCRRCSEHVQEWWGSSGTCSCIPCRKRGFLHSVPKKGVFGDLSSILRAVIHRKKESPGMRIFGTDSVPKKGVLAFRAEKRNLLECAYSRSRCRICAFQEISSLSNLRALF